MRMAAYGLAVQRVAEATTTRGLYPVDATTVVRSTTPTAATSASARVEVARARLRARARVRARGVDIGGDPELEARYRELLPVVEIDGERAFTYFVDAGRAAPHASAADVTVPAAGAGSGALAES